MKFIISHDMIIRPLQKYELQVYIITWYPNITVYHLRVRCYGLHAYNFHFMFIISSICESAQADVTPPTTPVVYT